MWPPQLPTLNYTDNHHSTNLLIMLFFFQFSKKLDFENPMVLNAVRGCYVLSNLLIAGVYLYVQMKIDKKRGMLESAT